MTPREFTIREFFKEIHNFNYVVQRNWDNLPRDYVVDGHDDLDLFATDDDKHRIESVLQKYPEIHCDVRSPEDNYYPKEMSEMLLKYRVEVNAEFFILQPEVAFLVLYYHNLIHKQDNPYGKKLNEMFKLMFPPVRCKDLGVGFYDNN